MGNQTDKKPLTKEEKELLAKKIADKNALVIDKKIVLK